MEAAWLSGSALGFESEDWWFEPHRARWVGLELPALFIITSSLQLVCMYTSYKYIQGVQLIRPKAKFLSGMSNHRKVFPGQQKKATKIYFIISSAITTFRGLIMELG